MFIPLPNAPSCAASVRTFVLCALMASSLAEAQDKPDFSVEIAPALRAHCFECHNNDKAKSDVNLESLVDEAAYLRSPDLLDAMIWVVEEHEMPPIDYDPKPTDKERERFVEWAQALLAEAQNAAPNQPGRVVMPRLNHLEYNQVIEDITGHPIDVADIFPRDGGGGEGFANVGEAQTATPMQVEKFLVAAKEVVDHATILAGGLISWNAEPQVDANNPLDRLESLKEEWADMHADMYRRLLSDLQTDVESGFEHRFTPYIEAAWRYHHRAGLGMPNADFAEIAESMELNIPPLILQKWYALMSQPQDSRYLDIIIRRFHAIDGPESLDDDGIRIEASRMAEYLELYGRQVKGDAIRPSFELEPEWTRLTDKVKRQQARQAYERNLDEGKYTFHIDLSKIEEPPQYLYLITSPAGDGNEDDIVIWSDGTFNNGEKRVSWRWHDGVQLTNANGQPLTWGDHPNYIGIERTSVGVKAPSIFRTAVPPGAKIFSVQARIDSQYGREGSVQVLIDTKPPQRMEELAGRFVLGIRDSQRRRELFQATREVRRAVFDHNIQENANYVFHGFPDLDPTRLANTRGTSPAPNPHSPFHLTVQELRTFAADKESDKMNQMAKEMVTILNPTETISNVEDARQVFESFAFTAWRRPPSSEEIDRLMALYETQRQLGLPFETAVRQCMAGILVSPNFLYRIQASRQSKEPYPLNDFELASRLSFALWGSIPDDPLIELAKDGRLRSPETLRAQMQRMLRHEKAASLSTNFAGHWLHFVGFEEHSEVDAERFEAFTPEVREAMAQEVNLFFADLIRNDGSVLDILSGSETFLNEELAEHYGIDGVEGPQMRKVELPPETKRRGVVTMAALLTKTSKSLRTSPVARGDWILEKVLGVDLPAPPPDVPMLSDDETNDEGLTLHEQLAQHRASPQCMSCHVRIDPLGLAMENYDPIGRWRDQTFGGRPIVNHGELANGSVLEGIEGLWSYLDSKQDQFLNQLCTKFLGYALGRKVTITDRPLVEAMKESLAENDYRFSAMVETVLLSQQFLYRQDYRVDTNAVAVQSIPNR